MEVAGQLKISAELFLRECSIKYGVKNWLAQLRAGLAIIGTVNFQGEGKPLSLACSFPFQLRENFVERLFVRNFNDLGMAEITHEQWSSCMLNRQAYVIAAYDQVNASILAAKILANDDPHTPAKHLAATFDHFNVTIKNDFKKESMTLAVIVLVAPSIGSN
jgi:hypothetical protein